MPLVLEPDSTYEYVLSCDAHKPKEEQPTFIFKYLSSRKWREVAKLSDTFDKDDAGNAAIDAVFEAIQKTLAGWRNMIEPNGKEIEFDAKKLEDIVTPAEAMELLRASVSQMPTVEDKKKLDSQSTSSTARSATRVKGGKTARKNRQNSSR
jgi:hypothetical protein